MSESLREADDIRRNLGRDRDLANSLDQAIQGLRRANDALMRDDMQTALLLKDQVIDPLRNVEMELSKRLQMKLGKNNLRLSDEGEAPAAYRRAVDEYFAENQIPIFLARCDTTGRVAVKPHLVWHDTPCRESRELSAAGR